MKLTNGKASARWKRVFRVLAALLAVQLAYGAYAFLAVPWIEPEAKLPETETISSQQRQRGSRLIEARLQVWKDHFAPDAWELNRPKILESHCITLLMEDYRNREDGCVELHPCTIIFVPKGPAHTLTQRRHQAVILQAPQGAVLQFDEPLDLRHAKIGRLELGRLCGPITIRSKGKSPGPEDDLRITTRDVELTERNLRTSHPVEFQLGPNHGRGRQLSMELVDNKQAKQSAAAAADPLAIRWLQLEKLEQLHLELDEDKLASLVGGDAARQRPAGPKAAKTAKRFLVEITCRGPFRFDNTDKVATFEDQVNVYRINQPGPSDLISCELLSVFFAEKRQAAAEAQPATSSASGSGSAGRANSTPLWARSIEARGNPVVVSMPSQKPPIRARGQRLQYDFYTKKILLEDAHEVMLKQGDNQLRAPQVEYQLSEAGRLGRIVAAGPGWLRGIAAGQSPRVLEASWKQQLKVRPQEGNQLISLSGGAWLSSQDFGRLEATEIHFWLLEVPADQTPGHFRLLPDRMLARGNVGLQSPQLSGTVKQLEVWFAHSAEAVPGPADSSRENSAAMPPAARRGRHRLLLTAYHPAMQHNAVPPVTAVPPPGLPAAVVPQQHPLAAAPHPHPIPLASGPSQQPGNPQRHFQIAAGLLQARLLLKPNQQAQLAELIMEDDVHLLETQGAEPNQPPMAVDGERLHVADANTLYATITVVGRPAKFSARGLALKGGNINLNRGTNRLWIDGPGEMEVPLDRDLEGRPTPRPTPMTVHWQQRMQFDGRTARFEESVAAAAAQQQLRTDTLDVLFHEPVRFSETKLQQNPDVEAVLCRGYVYLEGRRFQGTQQSSYERMEVTDLAINRVSGTLTAGGPGWLSSVRRGGTPLGGTGATPAGSPAPTLAPPDDARLRGVYVRFHGPVNGDLRRRLLTFHDQVSAAYGPVDSWAAALDPDEPHLLPPEGVTLHCDHLTVNEMPTQDSSYRELAAEGNVRVVGHREDGEFFARAARMTYTEAKNLLVLEGDGRSDAELFRQERIGGPISQVAARKINYWPQSGRLGRLSVEDARWLQSSWLSSGKPRRQPPLAPNP